MAYSAGRGLWKFDDPGEYKNFHRWIRGGWFTIEIAMIAVGLIALKFFHFPFLTAPIAFTLWYMSMDVTPILADSDTASIGHLRRLVSLSLPFVLTIVSVVTIYLSVKLKRNFNRIE